jgi:hypothetical protein
VLAPELKCWAADHNGGVNKMRVVKYATLAMLVGQSACGGTTTAPGNIRADGFMERSVEGCFRIVTSDRIFQPLVLAAEFQVDGLPVRFEAKLKPTFNTCMAGETVELLHIERRN